MPRLTRIKELQIIWQTWIILKSGLENVTLFLSRVYKTLNRRFQKHVNQACSHVVTKLCAYLQTPSFVNQSVN